MLHGGGVTYIARVIDANQRPNAIIMLNNIVRNYNWFLWALFYCSLAILILSQMEKNIRIPVLPLGLVVITTNICVPDYLNSVGYKMMFPFFLFGYSISRYHLTEFYCKFNMRYRRIALVILTIIYFICALILVNPEVISAWHCYTFGDLYNFLILIKRWGINLLGSLLIFTLVFEFGYNKENRILYILGQHSLGIYMISTVLLCFTHCIQKIRLTDSVNVFVSAIYILFISNLTIILCMGIEWLLRKNRFISKLFLGVG